MAPVDHLLFHRITPPPRYPVLLQDIDLCFLLWRHSPLPIGRGLVSRRPHQVIGLRRLVLDANAPQLPHRALALLDLLLPPLRLHTAAQAVHHRNSNLPEALELVLGAAAREPAIQDGVGVLGVEHGGRPLLWAGLREKVLEGVLGGNAKDQHRVSEAEVVFLLHEPLHLLRHPLSLTIKEAPLLVVLLLEAVLIRTVPAHDRVIDRGMLIVEGPRQAARLLVIACPLGRQSLEVREGGVPLEVDVLQGGGGHGRKVQDPQIALEGAVLGQGGHDEVPAPDLPREDGHHEALGVADESGAIADHTAVTVASLREQQSLDGVANRLPQRPIFHL
mmetsp:Transcript_30721/g.77721  ORF Transcript_30721/g.77721 Transcript_30721/m.77721 type:complete len:333 (+) Transcript_30721:489-1487(+)